MNLLLPHPAPADDRFWLEDWPSFLARAPLAPFAEESLQFLDAFSKKILLDPALRVEPAFAALAHWARRGHLQDCAGKINTRRNSLRAARGIILHLAPANVDTLFAYSWFTSLLCGNLNIVRVSARSLPVIAPLLETLRLLLAEPRFAAVRERTLLVGYDHDDTMTSRLSATCHGRLIWGGDETVRTIRALPLPATALEIAFADRFSLAALSAAPVAALTDTRLAHLAGDFYNDSFQFGQKACASPRMLVFTGEAAVCTKAASRFWPALATVVRAKREFFSEADGIGRLSSAMAMAAALPGARLTVHPADGAPPLVLQLPVWTPDLRALHDGAGLFVQLDLPRLADLAPLLTPRDQTLVAFGFSEEELRAFAAVLPSRALDRIVPPGHALDFDPTAWDGHNLLELLTRETALPDL